MKKKSEFEAPYIGIETIDNTPISITEGATILLSLNVKIL